MNWFKTRFGSSFFALFTTSSPALLPVPEPAVEFEEVRAAMLALLDGVEECAVTRRVRYALDVQALWYLRGDVLGTLATRCGETAAFEKINALTPMFRGALPEGLTTRRSPLGGRRPGSAVDSA